MGGITFFLRAFKDSKSAANAVFITMHKVTGEQTPK